MHNVCHTDYICSQRYHFQSVFVPLQYACYNPLIVNLKKNNIANNAQWKFQNGKNACYNPLIVNLKKKNIANNAQWKFQNGKNALQLHAIYYKYIWGVTPRNYETSTGPDLWPLKIWTAIKLAQDHKMSIPMASLLQQGHTPTYWNFSPFAFDRSSGETWEVTQKRDKSSS